MKDFKTLYKWNCILRMFFVLCVTVASIYFKNTNIMFFNLAVLLMGIGVSSNKKSTEEQSSEDENIGE